MTDLDPERFTLRQAAQARDDFAQIVDELDLVRLYVHLNRCRHRLAKGAPNRNPEHERKCRMIAAHSSQRASLLPFRLDHERFRVAPAYDFGELPNGGALLYERYHWGMNGALWRELTASARAKLGLMEAP